MEKINKKHTILDIRPWLLADSNMINEMLRAATTMEESELFPNELKPAVIASRKALEYELASRN